MNDDGSQRRLNRLAERAKQLDDMIQKAAAMQKKIVEEIRQIGVRDKVTRQRPTRTPVSKGRMKRR